MTIDPFSAPAPEFDSRALLARRAHFLNEIARTKRRRGPRLDSRSRVGALPRCLLHRLGLQARRPNPFRERPLTSQPETSRACTYKRTPSL